jgi:hypothetical protein
MTDHIPDQSTVDPDREQLDCDECPYRDECAWPRRWPSCPGCLLDLEPEPED